MSLTHWPMLKKKVIKIVSSLIYSMSRNRIYYQQIKSYYCISLFRNWLDDHFESYFHSNQWSKLCNTIFFCIFNHMWFTWHTTKKHRKSWFWLTFQCYKLRSHTEWESPPQSRLLLDLTINPLCGFSCVQGKGFGRNIGTEVTMIAGHEWMWFQPRHLACSTSHSE